MSGTDKDLGVTTASSDLCVHPDADMMTTVTVTVTVTPGSVLLFPLVSSDSLCVRVVSR